VAIFSRDLPADGLGILDAMPRLPVQAPRRPGSGPATPRKPALVVPQRFAPQKLAPRPQQPAAPQYRRPMPDPTHAAPQRGPALRPGSLKPGGSFSPTTRTAAGPQSAPTRPSNTPGGGGYVPQQPSFAPSAGDGGGGGGYAMPDGEEEFDLPSAADLPALPELPQLPGTPSEPGSSNTGYYVVGGIALAGLGFLATAWLRRRR
jgi:MYXO-CTERM domain-containing protein